MTLLHSGHQSKPWCGICKEQPRLKNKIQITKKTHLTQHQCSPYSTFSFLSLRVFGGWVREPCALLVGQLHGANMVENSDSFKTKLPYDPEVPHLGICPNA